ncbi:MAG: hypothetical protein J6X28_02160 [Bacilli bacterium]|nr:hypothetical protein [Bacilli bacterium]
MLNEQQIMDSCKEDPSVIFKMIHQGHFEIIEKMVEENCIDVNAVDGVGNDIVTRLLKARQYDLVVQLMKKRNWNVNHKNQDGNTFGHVLAHDNSLCAVKVVEQLNKKKNYIPNLKNNKGETIFDRALSCNYLCTALKILEDKRFTSIDVTSFKTLCNTLMKSREYGKYTKINTLEIIVDNLEKKDLEPSIRNLVETISMNMDGIKKDILQNDSRLLYSLMNHYS